MARLYEPARRPPPPPKMNRFIDLNTDFGQTSDRDLFDGKERTLLNFVSSVNIPCCVHDSEPAQVLKDIQTAKMNGCAVGAHIAFPDPKHYGYNAMDLSEDELYAWVILQLGAFRALAQTNRLEIEHIRPHGALYSAFISDESLALTVAKAVHKFDPWGILIIPVSPVIEKLQTEVNLQYAQEIYLGKRFSSDGVLILERFGENLHPQGVIEQVKQLLTDASVTTEDGKVVKVNCKTMHLSPKLQGSLIVAERINAMLGQRPIALSLATAGNSGWL